MLYQTSLVRITGFLQVSITPADALLTVGGNRVSAGLLQLPVGNYVLLARSFGYTDFQQSIVISEKSITTVTVALAPAAFAVTSFALPKPGVNPENPGLLGTIEGNFSVTGPGSGIFTVYDADSRQVYSRKLPDFATWDQAFAWDLRDSTGKALGDGTYTLSMVAKGNGSDVEVKREAFFTVDRTLKVAPRSLWSGSSGLLYAPVTEVLPPGDFQLGVLGAAFAQGDVFRMPVLLGTRIGIAGRMEVDASAGIIPSSTATPFVASVAARWSLLAPHGDVGTGSAIQAKLSVQYNPGAGPGRCS